MTQAIFPFSDPNNLDLSEGFEAGNDTFGHADFGLHLARILTESDLDLPLALEGEWGTGKTYFLKMLEGHMRKSGGVVVYFDAYRFDHHEDPFSALCGAIYTEINKGKDLTEKIKASFLENAASVAKTSAIVGAKVIARQITGGLVDLSEVGEGIQDAIDDAGDSFDKFIEQRIVDFGKQNNQIELFQNSLSSLTHGNKDGNIVIIIDELDRCRPDFALRLLEVVKHVFDTKSVSFLISVNTNQFVSSIRAVHGRDFDAHKYLQRFFVGRFSLPKTAQGRIGHNAVRYFQSVVKRSGSDGGYVRLMSEFIGGEFVFSEPSLRDMERLYNLSRFVPSFSVLEGSEKIVVIVMMYLKCVHPDLAEKVKLGRITKPELSSVLNIGKIVNRGDQMSSDALKFFFAKIAGESSPIVGEQATFFPQEFENFGNVTRLSREAICRSIFDKFVDTVST